MVWSELADLTLTATRDILGETAIFTPSVTGVPEAVEGIFQRPGLELNADGTPFRSSGPALGVRLADLSVLPVQGDAVTVRSVDYEVADVDPDGQGGAKLILHIP